MSTVGDHLFLLVSTRTSFLLRKDSDSECVLSRDLAGFTFLSQHVIS